MWALAEADLRPNVGSDRDQDPRTNAQEKNPPKTKGKSKATGQRNPKMDEKLTK